MPNQTYLYHRTKGKTLVSLDDTETLQRLEQEGWRDTPAAFNDDAQPATGATQGNDQEPKTGDDDGQYPYQDATDAVDDDRAELLDVFHEDPDALSEDQLCELGRYLGVKMMKAWKRDTLVKKVNSALE